MKRVSLLLLLSLILTALSAAAQSSCPPPTPGVPHVCLTWVAVTMDTKGNPVVNPPYNVFRSTTSGSYNFATPINATPIVGSTMFYDTNIVIGTKYFYVTTAGTGGAMSTPSNETSAQSAVPYSSPTAPQAAAD